MSENVRNQVISQLALLFEDRQESALYGLKHALLVERTALDLVQSLAYQTGSIDVAALQVAALLHDVGFAQVSDTWKTDQFEHIVTGERLAAQILGRISALSPTFIQRIQWLIQHHDDTVYAYPSATYGGHPAMAGHVRIRTTADIDLAILREADSQVHTLDDCAQEACQEWFLRGVPAFGPPQCPIATWRWMDSLVGNLRLLAKRALIDAYTADGTQRAVSVYYRLEKIIQEQCEAANVRYEPEICTPELRSLSLARMAHKTFDLQVICCHGWDTVDSTLRATTLLYDRSLHPYQAAEIASELVNLNDVSPMALYVLSSRVAEVIELHDALMIQYGFGIWDLPGLLEFRYNTAKSQILAPPVIEEYRETHWPDAPIIKGLVDGLHRCTAARQVGVSRIRASFTSNVPLPLVPLPAEWSEVQAHSQNEQLSDSQKRHYRYETLIDFPLGHYALSMEVTPENFRYFFYRDFAALGSKGKRDFHEFESSHAH